MGMASISKAWLAVLAVAAVGLVSTVLLGSTYLSLGFVGDLFVVLYFLVLPFLAIVVAGSNSGNPLSSVGAAREMKLLVAYELPFILAVSAVIIRTQPIGVSLSGLGHSVPAGLLPTISWWVSAVICFVIGILCMQAKLGYVPFDVAEAETEIMEGPFIEYSGPAFAVWKLSKAMMLFTLPLFTVHVFFGGLQSGAVGTLWNIVRLVILVVIVVLIKNTNPRVRIDQAVRFFWKVLTPLAVLAVIFAFWSR